MTHDNRDTALMGHEIVLQAQGLAKRYSRRRPWALREIDLEIPRGGITALVGPNAADRELARQNDSRLSRVAPHRTHVLHGSIPRGSGA